QQGRGLGAEAEQFGISPLSCFHPLDGLVVPLSGLIMMSQLPVSHRQEYLFLKSSLDSPPPSLWRSLSLSRAVRADFQSPARYCATPSMCQKEPSCGLEATAFLARSTDRAGSRSRDDSGELARIQAK